MGLFTGYAVWWRGRVVDRGYGEHGDMELE